IKLDGNGNLLWQKALGGNDDDDAQSVIQISNGSFIVAGSSLSKDGDVTQHHKEEDFWVVKVNESGSLVWQKSLGGSRIDIAKSVVESSDGNYVVTGYTQS